MNTTADAGSLPVAKTKTESRTLTLQWLWYLIPLLALPFVWQVGMAQNYDDAYITYTYSQNIVAGNGFVFNLGDTAMRTTTPLWTLVCAAFGFMGLDIPTVSNITGLLLLAAGALVFMLLLPESVPLPVKAVGSLPVVFNTWVMSCIGGEMPLYSLLIMSACLLFARERYLWAGVCAGLASVTRADGVLLVALLCGFALLLKYRREALLLIAGWCIAALPWFLFSLYRFGSLAPTTLKTKRAQMELAGQPSFSQGFQHVWEYYLKETFYRPELFLLLACGFIGLFLLRRNRGGALLVAWAVLFSLAYKTLSVPYYHWYYAPLFAPGAMLVVSGIGAAFSYAAKQQRAWRIGVTVALCVICGLWSFRLGTSLQKRAANGADKRYVSYKRMGEWLNANTPPDASIGLMEIGIMGYYARRHVIDFAGILQPDVADTSHGRVYPKWAEWAILKYQPDYLCLDISMDERLNYKPWFKKYKKIHHFPNSDFLSFTVYQRT